MVRVRNAGSSSPNNMHAGNLFNCVCCRDDKDHDEAQMDPSLGGPVCNECRILLKGATAWLKLYDMTRPLMKGDINQWNHKRFMP